MSAAAEDVDAEDDTGSVSSDQSAVLIGSDLSDNEVIDVERLFSIPLPAPVHFT